MLQLYNLSKVKVQGLKLYKDMNIESVLATGDKTLSFLYPARLCKEVIEECYIRTKKDEFVVKEIADQGEWKSIKATLNVENLEGQAWEHFETVEKTISECLTLAVAGTGWTVQVNGVTKRRTIRKTNCSTWDIIQQAKKTYLAEIEFDTINRIVKVAEKLGSDKGVYFMDSLNLRKLDVQSNSYDFYTRLIAIGKDDLKVVVENFKYSSKKKTLIWKDERYTDIASLTEDATKKLEEISKPYKAYGADIIDLANTSNKYSILSFGLGDTITLISKDKGIKEKQRIVKITEYIEEPHRNSCEIANSILSFADVQKEYNDNVDTVNNITSDNGTVSEGAIRTAVEHLTVNKLDVGSLNAVEIRVGSLEATSAKITQLDAINASIANLKANKAEIGDLTAAVGRVNILESSVADISTLVNGNLTSSNIHSLILSSDKVTVANGFIKNAMIENLNVSKILAGDISTNKFRIKSDNGGIEIVGATQQFKDKNNRVRIQMGQDTQGDFNFILTGEDGTTTLIDHNGIKEKAIANDLIKGNMISENAVGGKQIDYNSFTEEFNKDTNTKTLKSSKILLDKDNQTLDVAFNSLNSTVNGVKSTTENNTTNLNIQQGKIDSLISNTTIVKDGKTIQLKDSYNSTVATVDSINSTIGKHTSTIDALTGQITGIDTKVNIVQRDLDGVKTSVSNATTTANSALSKATEAKQTADGFSQRVGNIETNYATTSAMNSAITQSATGIKSEVSNTFVSKSDASVTYATKASMELTDSQLRLDFSSSGGYNLVRNGRFKNGTTFFKGWGSALSIYETCLRVSANTTSGTSEFGVTTSTFSIMQGKKYIIKFLGSSFYYTNALNYNHIISSSKGNIKIGDISINASDSTLREYTLTFTAPYTTDDASILLGYYGEMTSGKGFKVKEICIYEGTFALPWSPHPDEIYSSSTQIDGNGVEIKNGALKVTNTNSQVVIDGQYNMHKIVLSGAINISMAAGQYQRTATITHNLGYIPANLCFIQSDNGFVWNFPFMSYINFSGTGGLTINELGRAWANSSILEFVFVRPQDLTPAKTYKVRYYIYKEVAI